MPPRSQPETRLDPVAAYDRIAPDFTRVSDERRAYLHSIERIVTSQVPKGQSSLLDVGAGDGTRAFRIAKAAEIENVVLLEPSAAMRAYWPSGTLGWPIPAEELGHKTGAFDVILCLWNVLGHIFPAQNRLQVLREAARLLAPDGVMFVDVNHRYNARHYGFFATALRMLRDRIAPNEHNGDVTARWQVEGAWYTTQGHVFTHKEFWRMSREAGLEITKRFAVDYATGHLCRSRFGGNLLYVLRRQLTQVRPASSSANAH